MAAPVGFIGLGNMGRPMAENLVKHGFSLVVHDVDPAKTEPLRERGAAVAASAEAVAATVTRTIVMVETTAQAEEVIAGERGVIQSAQAGHIVVCMSTIDPFAARRLGDRLGARGVAMLDAPVSGGTGRAASGELSVIAGGARETFDACRDLFEAMGTKLFHVGGLGQGLAMKLVNNMLVQVNLVAVAEALVMGVKAGLDPQTIFDVVRVSTGTSYAFEHGAPKMLARDFSPGRQRRHLLQGPGARDRLRQAARRAAPARERHPAGLPDGARGRPQQAGRLGHPPGARAAGRRPRGTPRRGSGGA